MQNGVQHINLRCNILYVTRTKLKIYPINVEFTNKKNHSKFVKILFDKNKNNNNIKFFAQASVNLKGRYCNPDLLNQVTACFLIDFW